jgi:hypothetical protein
MASVATRQKHMVFCLQNEFQFDVSSFPQGLYVVQVMGEDRFYAKSFVKVE